MPWQQHSDSLERLREKNLLFSNQNFLVIETVSKRKKQFCVESFQVNLSQLMFDGMSKNDQNHFRIAIEMEISLTQIIIEQIEFVLVSELQRIEVFSDIFNQ